MAQPHFSLAVCCDLRSPRAHDCALPRCAMVTIVSTMRLVMATHDRTRDNTVGRARSVHMFMAGPPMTASATPVAAAAATRAAGFAHKHAADEGRGAHQMQAHAAASGNPWALLNAGWEPNTCRPQSGTEAVAAAGHVVLAGSCWFGCLHTLCGTHMNLAQGVCCPPLHTAQACAHRVCVWALRVLETAPMHAIGSKPRWLLYGTASSALRWRFTTACRSGRDE